MNAKSFFVVLMFILFGIILAGGALGDTDLTPDNGTTTTSSGASGASGGNTVSGLAITGNTSNSPCGSVYIVQPGDHLMKIARTCGVSLDDLVAFNPDIVDPDLIYPNQKINIVILPTLPPADVDPADVVVLPTAVPPTAAPVAATQTPLPTAAPAVAVKPGETVPVDVNGFQPFTLVQIAIGKVGEDGQVVREEITLEDGSIKVDVEVPGRAQPGETWVVTITAEREPRTVIQSPQFTITQ